MRVNDHLSVEKILVATEYFPVPNLQTLAVIYVNEVSYLFSSYMQKQIMNSFLGTIS